jgi:gluconate 2-dehydrogenase gamma chain
MDRREALKVVAGMPMLGMLPLLPAELEAGARVARAAVAEGNYQPAFFDAHEWPTVRLLGDMILPADDRSGSASDAGVPEFIDFTVSDRPAMQTPIRGGLAWLDAECRRRFGNAFIECGEVQRGEVLGDIAWPARARPEHSQGVAFFNRFRDLVAMGFWSSRMGVEDLQYTGNTYVTEWAGCPPEALERLGVSYE